MQSWPIIDRDLRIAARRISTYKHRLLTGGTAAGLVVFFSMFGPFFSARSGHYLFQVASWFGFLICILEGLRETVDSVAQERREGTLGLLFLTDLRGYDIILGKLSAASVKSFSTLLAMLPAFALPIWMGGVTMGEFWRVAASFAAILILSMTVGLFASAMSQSSFQAIINSLLLLSFGMLLPAANILLTGPIPAWSAGPFGMFYFAPDLRFSTASTTYWHATICSAIVCGVLFLASAKWVEELIAGDDVGAKNWFSKFWKPTRGYTDAWAPISLSTDPAVWLAEHALPGRRVLWALITGAGIVCFLVGYASGRKALLILVCLQLFFAFLLKIWIAALSLQPMNMAKRSGALELILCTPLRPQQLVSAHVEALRGYFIAPGLVASFGLIAVGVAGNTLVLSSDRTFEMGLAVISGTMCFVSFLLDLNALAYVGLWHGLSEVHVPQAVTKVVFRVLILPWFCLLIPCIGFIGLLIIPLLWMSWGRTKLAQRFEIEAVRQVSHDAANAGWFGSFKKNEV